MLYGGRAEPQGFSFFTAVKISTTMNLKFKGIHNKGTDNEFLLFYAEGNCNLRDYLLHDDTFNSDGELSNKLRHMYRFQRSVVVKKDEYVALYVKQEGAYKLGTVKINNATFPCHIFYWGLTNNIFNDNGDHLYLLRIAETSTALV